MSTPSQQDTTYRSIGSRRLSLPPLWAPGADTGSHHETHEQAPSTAPAVLDTQGPPCRQTPFQELHGHDADKKAIEDEPSEFARLWSEKEAKSKFFGTNLAEFLENEKKTGSNGKNMQETQNVYLHRFSFGNIPVTLCTKRDFSTIIFTCST